MGILDIYYQLHEKDSSTVSCTWKVIHLLAVLLAGVSSILAAVHFSHVLIGFAYNCVLYPSVVFIDMHEKEQFFNAFPRNKKVETQSTNWTDDFYCNYCSFVWIVSFITAVVLFAFICANSNGGRGYTHSVFVQPWTLVYPSLFISIMMSCATGYAAFLSIRGFSTFCQQFSQFLDSEKCTEKINIYTLMFNKKLHPINDSIDFVQLCSSITWCGWIFAAVTFLVRICLAPDFYLLIIKAEHKKHDTGTDVSKLTQDDENKTVEVAKAVSSKEIQLKPSDFKFTSPRQSIQTID